MKALEEVFTWVLRTSLAGGALACLILALKATVGKRWPARWHSALWILLLVRLSLPGPLFSLPLPGGFPRRAPQPLAAAATGEASALPAPGDGGPPPRDSRPLPAPALNARPLSWALRHPGPTLALGWLAGALLAFGYLLVESLRFAHAVRRGRVVTREAILVCLEAEKARLGIHTVLGLVETDAVQTPALFGLLRPRLLMPTGLLDRLGEASLRDVLRHELIHLRRLDLLTGWWMALLQALHWFNPLLGYAFHRIRQDRELSCDEAAVCDLDDRSIAGYGETLLALAGSLKGPQTLPGLAGISETRTMLARRILMLANRPSGPRARRWPLPSLLTLGAVLTLSVSAVSWARTSQARTYPVTPTAPTFQSDPAALGAWRAVDFVRDPSDFRPGRTSFQGPLAMEHLVLKADGTTNWAWSWTRGALWHPEEHSLGKYEIRTLGGREYLFQAWINGDVLRGETPWHYVYERDPEYREVEARTQDRIDYPFEDDPRLIGTWKQVGLVPDPSQFHPDRPLNLGDPADFSVAFQPGGRTPMAYLTWTRGLVLHHNARTASRYLIQEGSGRTFLLMEFKSGDYTRWQRKPKWMVLERQ